MTVNLQSSDPAATKPSFARSLAHRAITIAIFLAVIWLVWLTDALLFHGSLAQHGIVPRSIRGLLGILFAPFLHASLAHLWGNTLGILLLGGLLILRSQSAFWTVSIGGALAAGMGTWLIGHAGTVHVGASGVIFAYFGYLLTAGIFQRRLGAILLSFLVFFFWGGMLWSAIPYFTASNISWEGHIFGLLAGVGLAKLSTPPSSRKNPSLPS